VSPQDENNFVYQVFRRSELEPSKKPKVLNKGFIMDDNNINKNCEDRITKVNEKIKSIKKIQDNKSYLIFK